MKKRTVGILSGFIAAGSLVYLGSQLNAQNLPPQTQAGAAVQPAQPIVSRIAVVNLGQVIKNYQKFKVLSKDISDKSLAYKKAYDERQALVTARQAELSKDTTLAPRRDQIEHELRDLQRQMQDIVDDSKAKIGKMDFDNLVLTYKEVKDAVTAFARARNLEMVMHYNDGVAEDAYLPQIFSRKIANGACMPMYVADGMDITNDVTNMLNQRYASMAPPAPPVTGAPATPVAPAPGAAIQR